MSDAATIPGVATPPVLDVARRVGDETLAGQFAAMAKAAGLKPSAVVGAFARLTFGPGKVSFQDFVKLRLFDQPFHEGTALDAYVGQRRNRDLCVAINHRHDWLGLFSNKIASRSYLAAYGLPTIPTKAIYAPQASAGNATILTDRAALETFLSAPEHYPLFGKPVEGVQSLGSIGLRACHAASRELETFDGSSVPLDAFLSEVETHYAAGYLFQSLVSPHPDIRAVCGHRLATVRIVTIATEAGARPYRACWKIPSGSNAADNYWRSGNLLAQLDFSSGCVRRATSGVGLSTAEHTHHPDTGAPLVGFRHPHWQAMLDFATEGARLMRHVPMIGWDIACSEDGPVIVEMNEMPDLFLVQFADRKGVLEPEFTAFAAFQKQQAARHTRTMQAAIAKL